MSSKSKKAAFEFDHFAGAHRPFSWIPTGAHDPMASFAALTMDVCNGIHTCLELVESSEMERANNRVADPGDEVLPTLSECDSSTLMRLSLAAARLLSERAEKHIEHFNDAYNARHSAGEREAT